MTREKVFLSIERQMVAELGDDDLSHQSWSGDTAVNRPRGWRWTHDAVLAPATGVLGTDVNVHFQLRRQILQNPALVLPDASFRAAAARTLLVRFAHIVLVPIVGQLGQIKRSVAPATRECCFTLELVLR